MMVVFLTSLSLEFSMSCLSYSSQYWSAEMIKYIVGSGQTCFGDEVQGAVGSSYYVYFRIKSVISK